MGSLLLEALVLFSLAGYHEQLCIYEHSFHGGALWEFL